MKITLSILGSTGSVGLTVLKILNKQKTDYELDLLYKIVEKMKNETRFTLSTANPKRNEWRIRDLKPMKTSSLSMLYSCL